MNKYLEKIASWKLPVLSAAAGGIVSGLSNHIYRRRTANYHGGDYDNLSEADKAKLVVTDIIAGAAIGGGLGFDIENIYHNSDAMPIGGFISGPAVIASHVIKRKIYEKQSS